MKHDGVVFDYRALRLLMGMIVFALPFVVSVVSSDRLSSISASYHTDARDMFVGMLFIVGAFLWAYNGHTSLQSTLSKVAAFAAILVALFPTSCDACSTNVAAIVHYVSALVLFSTLAFFCFGPFRLHTKGKGGKKGRRSKMYLLCGWIMVGCMVAVVAANIAFSKQAASQLRITFWAEAVALWAFGVAWMVSGKAIKLFADKDEALKVFS